MPEELKPEFNFCDMNEDNQMPELKPCPFCGEVPYFDMADRIVCGNHRCSVRPVGITVRGWNERPAEKLVPLDADEVHILLDKLWLKFQTHKGTHEIAEGICARFASVPVVVEVIWPTDKPVLETSGKTMSVQQAEAYANSYRSGWNDRGEADKAVLNKAIGRKQ